MADPVPADVAGDHVDFEVLAVMESTLVVRFRLNDKHVDMILSWDGKGDVIDYLKKQAAMAVFRLRQLPPPPFDLLQAQVGKQGHVIVPLPAV